MNKKFFPIQSATACRLKWSWSTLYLNDGTTSSCHRASFGAIPDNFDDFHNTHEKLRDRSLMLNGQWPENGCEYCRDIEYSGGQSDRQFQNQVPDIWSPELADDTTAITVSPAILEVFFNNTCNLACVYCKPELSSRIEAERRKFNISTMPVTSYDQHIEKFWSWMHSHGHKIQRLQILGGEPLLQQDFDRVLDYYTTNPAQNLELNIITNACVPEKIWTKKLDQLADLVHNKCVGRVDLQISVDSWGAGQEYVRWGFDTDLFEHNLKYAQSKKCFRIGLLSTISSLSILEMPALARKFVEWNQEQEIFWYMQLVLPVGVSVFEPVVFDYSVFEEALEQVKNTLPTKTWDQQQTVQTFCGIDQKLKAMCSNNVLRQQNLLKFLETNDYRRGTNWQQTFPWLIKHLDNSYVV